MNTELMPKLTEILDSLVEQNRLLNQQLVGTRIACALALVRTCLTDVDPRAAADMISAELSGIGVAVADKSAGFHTFGITDALEAIATMVERTVEEKLIA
jgi:hypothetical protein